MQHPTQRLSRHDMFASLRRWTGSQVPAEELPIGATVASMDEGGVGRGLVCAWYGPDGPLISNDEVAGWVAQHPDRLTDVASVDLRSPVAAVRELRRAVHDLGLRARRVVPWLWGLPPNHRLYYPLLAECVDLGIPFMTPVGHTGPLRSSETGRPIRAWTTWRSSPRDGRRRRAHRLPADDRDDRAGDKYPHVYIDTSAYVAHRYPAELVEYLRGSGRRKVLFGSNYPVITAARALERLDRLGLDDEARALFLSGNAERLFPTAETVVVSPPWTMATSQAARCSYSRGR